jgi:hypothetical protein
VRKILTSLKQVVVKYGKNIGLLYPLLEILTVAINGSHWLQCKQAYIKILPRKAM